MSRLFSPRRVGCAAALTLALHALPVLAAATSDVQNGNGATPVVSEKAVQAPYSLDLTQTAPGAPFQGSLANIDLRSLLTSGLSLSVRLFVAQPSWVNVTLSPVSSTGSSFANWYSTTSTDSGSSPSSQSGDDASKRLVTLQVSVTPVPEPADWLAMGAGLTLLVGVARLRARRAPRS